MLTATPSRSPPPSPHRGRTGLTPSPPPPRQLAQVHIARLRYPADDSRLHEFTSAVAAINALAEHSPGFVWLYPTSDGHLSGTDLLGDPLIIINLSAWTSYQHLHAFTYRSRHGLFVRRRAEWFTPLAAPTTALWWIPAGQPPTPEHALARLRRLRQYGPTPQAFTVRRRFTPEGTPESRTGRLTGGTDDRTSTSGVGRWSWQRMTRGRVS